MLKAVLKYSNGVDLITWVDSEPNGQNGFYVNDYANDGNKVFKFKEIFRGSTGKYPIYVEIKDTVEEFYGYEKKTAY